MSDSDSSSPSDGSSSPLQDRTPAIVNPVILSGQEEPDESESESLLVGSHEPRIPGAVTVVSSTSGPRVAAPAVFAPDTTSRLDPRLVSASYVKDPNAGVALPISWTDASVRTKKSRFNCCSTEDAVTLLEELSGSANAELVCVMGPSGCGKTTFLNMLAKRFGKYEPGPKLKLQLGGQEYSAHQLKPVSGYVCADDVLFPHLTVRETLEYGAQLRMPRELTKAQKIERVDQVISRLGLIKCQNTRIGDSIIRGVSGGERKRVCIGLELLSRPRILFCDTPTSGLDSATAFSVCQLLADLAHSGECTVVCSLNQPQIKIWNLIDKLLVLHEGELVYQGNTTDIMELYARAGYPCPPEINPADHILDVITPLFREDIPFVENNLQTLRNTIQTDSKYLQQQQQQQSNTQSNSQSVSIALNGTRMGWLSQVRVLLGRTAVSQMRDRFSVYLQIIQMLIMGVLVGGVFFDIGTDQNSISKRQSVLFFCCINQGIFAALLALNSYPADRNVVLRERAAGTYHVSAYFVAKTIIDMVIQLIYPLIFTVIVYWMVGLQADAGKFFLFLLFMELASANAFAWATLTSAACITVNRSLSVLPLVFEVFRLFGGFFIPPIRLPDYFVWLDAISYVKYAYTGIALNELDGLDYTCTPDQLQPPINGTCPVTSGQQTVETLGLDYISLGGCIGVLIGMLVFLRFCTYLLIRLNKG